MMIANTHTRLNEINALQILGRLHAPTTQSGAPSSINDEEARRVSRQFFGGLSFFEAPQKEPPTTAHRTVRQTTIVALKLILLLLYSPCPDGSSGGLIIKINKKE
jgi:hypothetical protein